MITEKELLTRLQTRKIRAIIFDFDGTLLDIKKILRKAIEYVFNDYKVKADMEVAMNEIGALLETIQGHPIPKIILQAHDIFQYITSLKHISFLKKLRIGVKIFSKYMELSKDAKLFPGVKTLLESLSKDYQLFIVSHNKTGDIVEHLEKEGLVKTFKGIYGTDDLPQLKPHPDAFLPVYEILPDLKSDEAVMIGDMPTDIQAAQEAGFWTIALTSGISKEDILAQFNPDLIVSSIQEIIDKLDLKTLSKANESVSIKS